MVNRKTKFAVGFFVATGISIAIVAIIWLGMSRFFEKGSHYSVYFDESVQGLQVDSPVKYRGVSIGLVERIGVGADSRLIEVVMKIESGQKLEEDMVAQLRVVGITGSKFIELDRMNEIDRSLVFKPDFPTEYQVIGSRPSEISELFRGIDEIVQKLNMLDIAGISDRLKNTLDHVDQSVVSSDLKGISDRMKLALDDIDRAVIDLNLPGISADVKTTLASLNSDLDPERWQKILAGIEEAVEHMKEVTDNTNALLKNASGAVDETEEGIITVNRQISVISRDLEKASSNLNRLLEGLADQPSRLLFAEPPPRRLPAGAGEAQ